MLPRLPRLSAARSAAAGFGFCFLAVAACGERQAGPTHDSADPVDAAPAGDNATTPDGDNETAPAGDNAAAIAVSASDEFGPFSSPITGVAIWAHPLRPFEGLLFAASADGLVSYNIEDGVEIARDDGFSADGVAIAYFGSGVDAEAVIASRDAAAGQFRFYTVDNETRMPSLRPAMMVTDARAEGFCLGKAPGVDGAVRGLQLVALAGKSFTRYELQFTAAGVSTIRSDAGAAPELLAACVLDDVDGSVFLASENGEIYLSKTGQTVVAFAGADVSAVAGLGAALNQQEENGEIQGQIALLDGGNGHVHLFDRKDGRAFGIVKIGASFDLEAVAAATTIGVGYGNYGAIYRNGMLALATNGDAPSVRLISWNGVLNALGQPEVTTADPRALHQADEDDGLIIDIDIIDP